MLLVEQDAKLALKHSDRGYVMRTGRIVLAGSAAELVEGRVCAHHLSGFVEDGGRRHMIWNTEYECMDRGELAKLQLRRLQTTVAWVYDRVPYYRAAAR